MMQDGDRISAEIDALAAAVAAAPDDVSRQQALWRRVARLPAWYYIARGEADAPRPFSVALDRGPVLCVYSTPERASDAARRLGLVDPEATGAPLLSVPMPAALDHAASLAHSGVFGIALDYPQIGHWIPLENLPMLRPPTNSAG